MTRSKNASKNIITSLVLQVVVAVCGLILPRAIIGAYGSGVNGLVASITQFLSYISLLDAGVGQVIKAVLYKPIAEKDKNMIAKILNASQKFFNKLALCFVIYVGVLCFLFPTLVANEFSADFTVPLIIIIAISTMAEYLFGVTYRLFLQASQETYVTEAIQIGTTVLNTVVAVILIKTGASIQAVKLATALIFVLRPVLQNIYVRKKYKISLKKNKEKYILKQRWDGFAQHVAAVLHENTDIVLLTIFSTTVEVSVYAVYLMVMTAIKGLVKAFTSGMDAIFGDMRARGEKENLRKKFGLYEVAYFSVIMVVFACTASLILPFVSLYTADVTDVNYYRPAFAILMTAAELMYAIRLPFSALVLSAGHFKQTRKGAWLEAGLNITVSLILVGKMGIVGVAIGTLVAMTVRTTEFIIYGSKKILEQGWGRKLWHAAVTIMGAAGAVAICNLVNGEINGYGGWIMWGVVDAAIAGGVMILVNLLFFRKEFLELLKYLWRKVRRK